MTKNATLSFGEKMKDGRLTEPSSGKERFDVRAAVREVEKLGRPLTASELEKYGKK